MLKEIRLSSGVVRYRDEGSGPPLVFVHGLLVSGTLWRKVVPLLSRAHRCIVPDWPLGSHTLPLDRDADVSPTGVAALIAELLEALDLDDVTLVGNDSGGALCQLVITRHPARIGRLVLTTCDAFEIFPPREFAYLRRVTRVPGLMRAMAWLMLRFPSLRRLPRAYGALTTRPIAEEVLADWVRPSAVDAGVRRDVRKFLAGVTPALTLDAAARLSSFTRPVLLVWSAADRFFPLSLGQRLHAALPQSRLVVLDGARVFLPEDRPEELAAHVAAFTDSSAPRSSSSWRPATDSQSR